MKSFVKIEDVLKEAIDDLDLNHITPLKNDEHGLSIARVTNDSVSFTSAGASLALPVAVIPCLATTIVASLSILGTARADFLIHQRAESRIKDFMNKFKSEPHIHTLQLNDNYKAVVDLKEKTVKVGCQTFNFEVINKLSELIKKDLVV